MSRWLNFRAIGNTAGSLLYRGASADLITTTNAISVLETHQISYLLDLRTSSEIGSISWLPAFIKEYKNIPLSEEVNNFKNILFPHANDYINYYQSIIQGSLHSLRDCFEFIHQALRENRKLLFYCHAGKDRTGILACLTMLIGGVKTDMITKDYILSGSYLLPNIHLFEKHWLSRGITKEAYLPRMQPQAMVIENIITAIRKHGTVEQYFCHHHVPLQDYSDLEKRLINNWRE